MQDCSLNLPRARARAHVSARGRAVQSGWPSQRRMPRTQRTCTSSALRWGRQSVGEQRCKAAGRQSNSCARRAACADQAATQPAGRPLVLVVRGWLRIWLQDDNAAHNQAPHRRMASRVAGPSESPAAFAAPPAPHALPGAVSRACSLRARLAGEPPLLTGPLLDRRSTRAGRIRTCRRATGRPHQRRARQPPAQHACQAKRLRSASASQCQGAGPARARTRGRAGARAGRSRRAQTRSRRRCTRPRARTGRTASCARRRRVGAPEHALQGAAGEAGAACHPQTGALPAARSPGQAEQARRDPQEPCMMQP